MPSPFPGMDPYLEGSLWTTLHFALAAEIVRQLAPRLRPRYVALPLERMVMETPEDIAVTTTSIYPDVSVVESQQMFARASSTAIATPPLRLATIMPSAIPHVSIEIRDIAERQLVTAIEILSPTNKRGEGRKEYLSKRQRILLSTTHLLEIDLLRTGQRVPMQQLLPSASYFIFLSRAESRPIVDVWPVSLQQALPSVQVPLLAGDADLILDLQQTFSSVYDLLGYDLLIDYTQPPEIPLSVE